jgi:poly-gamma-glutamate capsule biosynthesis protein CapA/YwtB (metallophosphatase superfamily)
VRIGSFFLLRLNRAVRVSSALFMLLGCQLYAACVPSQVQLALLGDVMLGRGVAQAHSGSDWEGALAELAPRLSTADLALANLESPLGESVVGGKDFPSSIEGYNLCAPPEAALALQSAGLDLLSLANNHSRDCFAGEAGTAEILHQAGMEGFSSQPVYRTVRGTCLSFLAFEDVSARLDVEVAAQTVAEARQRGCLVVVSVHWGMEYQVGEDAVQRSQAQALTDAGAALIWGHHPHVLQPVEWLQGKGQARPALVAYSLGNALFDQPLPMANRSALLLVTLDSGGVRSYDLLPFEIDPQRGRVVLP